MAITLSEPSSGVTAPVPDIQQDARSVVGSLGVQVVLPWFNSGTQAGLCVESTTIIMLLCLSCAASSVGPSMRRTL